MVFFALPVQRICSFENPTDGNLKDIWDNYCSRPDPNNAGKVSKALADISNLKCPSEIEQDLEYIFSELSIPMLSIYYGDRPSIKIAFQLLQYSKDYPDEAQDIKRTLNRTSKNYPGIFIEELKENAGIVGELSSFLNSFDAPYLKRRTLKQFEVNLRLKALSSITDPKLMTFKDQVRGILALMNQEDSNADNKPGSKPPTETKLIETWNEYCNFPSKENAKSFINLIPRTGPLDLREKHFAEVVEIFKDLKIVLNQMIGGDPSAAKLCIRLFRIADGANYEYMQAYLSYLVRICPKSFLHILVDNKDEEYFALNGNPVNHISYDFTDRDEAALYELEQRKNALSEIMEKNVETIKQECIKILESSIEYWRKNRSND